MDPEPSQVVVTRSSPPRAPITIEFSSRTVVTVVALVIVAVLLDAHSALLVDRALRLRPGDGD